MLDLNALNDYTEHDKPYRWYSFDNLVDTKYKDTFHQIYPTDIFERVAAKNISKAYQFDIANVIVNNELMPVFDTLHEKWKELINSLSGMSYKSRIGEVIKKDIKQNKCSIGFYKFIKGDFVSPHLDKPNKIFTQLFYFNTTWKDEWGGLLRLLKNPENNDESICIPPSSSRSILLPRTDSSWHTVDKINPNTQPERLSLQFEVWDN